MGNPSYLFHILHKVEKGAQNLCHGLHLALSEMFQIVACYSRGVHIFQNSRSYLRIVGAGTVT